MEKKKKINFKVGLKRIAITLSIFWIVFIILIGIILFPERQKNYDKNEAVKRIKLEEMHAKGITPKISDLPVIRYQPLNEYIAIVLKHIGIYTVLSLIGSILILGSYFLLIWIADGFKE